MAGILPHIMRRRNDASVWFSSEIDVEEALAYVRRVNAEAPGSRYSLFGLVLAAAVRVFALKPKLNRFVSHRAVYQRQELSFSFIVKPSLTESSPERSAKVRYDPGDSLRAVMGKTNAAIDELRGGRSTPDENEMRFLGRIPGARSLFTELWRLLDALNLAPASLIRHDPLYTSAYFANLGSLGLATPYHHLYEWGTASLFVSMGRVYRKDCGKGAGRRHITLKITLDERIADGIYFAHAASLLSRFLRKPVELERPLAELAGDLANDTAPPASGGGEVAGDELGEP